MSEIKLTLELAKLALYHDVPGDCYSTGPLSGTAKDHHCIVCNALKAIEADLKRMAAPVAAPTPETDGAEGHWKEQQAPGKPIDFASEVVNLLEEIFDRVPTPDDPERGILFAHARWLTRHFRKHPELCLPSPFAKWVASPAPADGFVKMDNPDYAQYLRKDWVMVPRDATEDQWGGLARSIMMWLDMAGNRPKLPEDLLAHLERSGVEAPAWLLEEGEMKAIGHSMSKGTRCVLIYKAMLNAAPKVAE